MSGEPTGEHAALDAALAALWTHHRDDVVDLIAEIRAFVDSGLGAGDAMSSAEAAERAAHRLAGSLGTFGLGDASATARELEELIDADRRGSGGDVARARELVSRLANEVAAFDAARKPPSVTAETPVELAAATARPGRAIGLVGLDGTMAASIREQAALRQVGTRVFADLDALDDDAVGALDAVVVDIDRVPVDVLGPGGWASARPPFVALSVGRRLTDRVAASRASAPAATSCCRPVPMSCWPPSSRCGRRPVRRRRCWRSTTTR